VSRNCGNRVGSLHILLKTLYNRDMSKHRLQSKHVPSTVLLGEADIDLRKSVSEDIDM